jgi:hypothetical protein
MLPEAVAQDRAPARFERNFAHAALNHPNIVTIYAVEAEGSFLAMGSSRPEP